MENPPKDEEHGEQRKDENPDDADADAETALPLCRRCADSIKTLACIIVVLAIMIGFIVLANVFGFAKEKGGCNCANGQARTCASGLANRDINVMKTQTSLLDNQFNNIGVALNGYDVVQYSLQSPDQQGVLGCPEFNATLTTRVSAAGAATVVNENFTFWFKSAENRDKFALSPWQFVPRYGGFDAYLVAKELEYPDGWDAGALGPTSDPVNLWTLRNQTLYLFADPNALKDFQRSPDTIMKSANMLWTNWYGSLQAGPINTQCFAQTWKCCRACGPPSKSAVFQAVPVPPNVSLACQPQDKGRSCPA